MSPSPYRKAQAATIAIVKLPYELLQTGPIPHRIAKIVGTGLASQEARRA